MKTYAHTPTGSPAEPPQMPTQTPIIEVTARQLEMLIAELQKIADTLESRLTSILCEPEPSQIRPDDPDNISSAESAFTVMLRRRVQEVENVSYQLASIIRRLEI